MFTWLAALLFLGCTAGGVMLWRKSTGQGLAGKRLGALLLFALGLLCLFYLVATLLLLGGL